MIRIKDVKIGVDGNLKKKIMSILNTDIIDFKINKLSIDARKKGNALFVYEVDVNVFNENKILSKNIKNVSLTPKEEYVFDVCGDKCLNDGIVIVGAGPAGLFAGYELAKSGYNPLIIERGKDVDSRIKDVERFWKDGILDVNSNVQFGAGGAGTFSDGKLNTQCKDRFFRNKEVLRTFVKFGAPEEILYLNKPHIGTDLLRNVIKNMIFEIERLGGKIRYNSCLTNIFVKDKVIDSIEINGGEVLKCDGLVLALGHSSRDTFEMLLKNNLCIKPKPFAVGVRVQHKQDMINKAQYGDVSLPAASYKLTYQASNKRGVYSFCMCPGGYVVNSSSCDGMLAINGMSDYKRDSENANSAIIVTVSPFDYGDGPLDGVRFQRKLEKNAYEVGKGLIPSQLFKDFKRNIASSDFGNINPVFKGGYYFTNIRDIFPEYINEALIEGIEYFDGKIKGFASDDVILSAVESRTSSPIKIIRDDNFVSNISGIYPCGEGAGYAGGIMTSAIDGIKVAEAIGKIYKPN